MSTRTGSVIIMFLLILSGCLDPYEPPVSKETVDFLVVDGHINASSGIATVKLSRGVSLGDEGAAPVVSDALVKITGSDGIVTVLPSVAPGRYEVSSYFQFQNSYRLSVGLQNGQSYVSDWITLQRNYPVENLRWEADDENLKFYTSVSVPDNGTYYFRYEYEETYEYRSVFQSDWLFAGSGFAYRDITENISTCWKVNSSSGELLASTEGLSQNVISDFNVLRIPKGDRRLWFGYSLKVKQYALDQQAFEYRENLRKVSESLGGLFDPIPFSVTGNIRPDSDNDGEPDSENSDSNRVLGYFAGGEITNSRINIRNFELPSGYYGTQSTTCAEAYVGISDFQSIVGRDVNLTRAQYQGLAIIGFYYAIPACTDCRLEGGVPLKPLYME